MLTRHDLSWFCRSLLRGRSQLRGSHRRIVTEHEYAVVYSDGALGLVLYGVRSTQFFSYPDVCAISHISQSLSLPAIPACIASSVWCTPAVPLTHLDLPSPFRSSPTASLRYPLSLTLCPLPTLLSLFFFFLLFVMHDLASRP